MLVGRETYRGNKLALGTYTFNPARNAFSTEKAVGSHRQINVNTISDFVGDSDISRLAGRGLLPGTSVFVSPTGGIDLPLAQRHSMDNVQAGLGEFLLRADRR